MTCLIYPALPCKPCGLPSIMVAGKQTIRFLHFYTPGATGHFSDTLRGSSLTPKQTAKSIVSRISRAQSRAQDYHGLSRKTFRNCHLLPNVRRDQSQPACLAIAKARSHYASGAANFKMSVIEGEEVSFLVGRVYIFHSPRLWNQEFPHTVQSSLAHFLASLAHSHLRCQSGLIFSIIKPGL